MGTEGTDGPRPGLADIRWFKTSGHDAEAEVLSLPVRSRDKALALLLRLSRLNAAHFRVKKTYVPHLFEAKLRTEDGGLRLLFAYGQRSVIWCLGGFVKIDDAKGNRVLESYAKLARIAKDT